MPSTHLCLHVHVVFSTKDREAFIADEWRDRLHAFLGGAARTAGAVPDAVGGTSDHVHLLVGFRATHRLSDLVRDIKQASSEWVHGTIGFGTFAWQEGYGAFTVSPSQRPTVRNYVANQLEHHRKQSFQEEYRAFLERAKVAFDERYLW
ncbi:MAG: IS200/IS605 family transposase [Verrucomicrobiales bacterium]|nr:IS200/IS605 family transposase [Verrucomicrobiales bacterium]